jgi:SAM-dependent methyltransferase
MLTPLAWHRRYLQQAGWTAALRRHLYERIGLQAGQRTLEVGCGTGAVTVDLAAGMGVSSFGLDLLPEYLQVARRADPLTRFVRADAYAIPFPPGAFDAILSHMFLLWIANPAALLQEITRVLLPGGWVLALAEPDYGGRIDFPTELSELGRFQSEALSRQGAFPQRGRELAGLFMTAGLEEVESGLLGGQWQAGQAMQGFEDEWQVLRSDLGGTVDASRLEMLYDRDRQARQEGSRILFVPTFYAIGRKSTG